MRLATSLWALATTLLLFSAGQAPAENVLRWGNADNIQTADPHSINDPQVDEVLLQIYETLIGVDSDMRIVGLLAVDWRPLDSATWQFELRQGVRFHDGTPFDAGDVVFSIRRAQAETSDFTELLSHITQIEAIDAHTINVTTARPDPLLWATLASIRIMSKSWCETFDVTLPADHDKREQTHASRNANGTGPFRLEVFEPVGSIVLTKHADWWGLQSYPHNIDRIERLMLKDTKDGVDALLTGEIDFLQELPFDWLAELEQADGVNLVRTKRRETAYLALNQSTHQSGVVNGETHSPFQDIRIRRAAYHAIDIDWLVEDVMDGLASQAEMMLPPGITGHFDDVAKRLPYDPARARSLLAEAGFPEGFSATLDCPDRFSLFRGEAVCRALVSQLSKIGIKTKIEFLPPDKFFRKIRTGKSDMYALGSFAFFDSQSNLDSLFHSKGAENLISYVDKDVDELITSARHEMITYARDVLLKEAWQRVTNDVVYVPLYHPSVVWAMRDNLHLPADPWWRPRFRLARFVR